MKRLPPHTTLLTLLAGIPLLLLIGGSPGADEPVDPADEVAAALTEIDALERAAANEASPADAPTDNEPSTARARPAAADDIATPATDDDQTPASPSSATVTRGDTPAPAATAAESDVDPQTPPEAQTAADALPGGDPPTTVSAAGQAPDPGESGVAIDMLSTQADEQTPVVPLAGAVTVANATTARTLTLLKADILPGTYQRLSWSATEMFEDLPVATPVLVVNGKSAGPTLCLTAAVHGDELNGIEMVRRVMHDLNAQKLSGAVIGVPIVNLQGFRRGSRYLPDRRDLNRYFPGNPRGSAASRIAHSFFTEVIEHCDALVDLHTGSFDRANLPQLRADLRNPDVVTLTQGFGATVILHSEPAEGTLRHAASAAGIATVTLEAGGPSELELKEVMHGVKGIETLLNTLGMVNKARLWADQQPVYYRSSWVRANRGGILLADVSLGSTVRRGDLLGTITDPMNNASTNLYSPYSGRVIGMARNQVVMPGFAAFHVGIQAVDASAVENDPQSQDGRQKRETLAQDADSTDIDYVDGMSE